MQLATEQTVYSYSGWEELSMAQVDQAIMENYERFFLLRYFNEIPASYFDKFAREPARQEEILRRLNCPEIKFRPEFATTPDELWFKFRNILRHNPSVWHWQGDHCQLSLSFTNSAYPMGIATDKIIAIDQLSKRERRNLQYKPRSKNSDYNYFFIPLEREVLTWQLNAELVRKDKQIYLRRLYPGTDHPGFVEAKKISQSKWENIMQFWQTHALVELMA